VVAALAEKAAWVEESRTVKEEDPTHGFYGLFYYSLKLHLPRQTIPALNAAPQPA